MAESSVETQLFALAKVSCEIHRCREVRAVLQVATRALCELGDARRAFVFLPDEASGNLAIAHSQDRAGAPVLEPEARVLQTARQVWQDRRAVLAVDAPGQAKAPVPRAPITELRLKLLACLPLIADQQPVGVAYADGRAQTDQAAHPRILGLLADHIATALDNARTFERASNDLLTGLPTNGYFLLQLGKALGEAEVRGPGGVVFIDLDAFCRINETAGNEVGDRAMVDVAQSLREGLQQDGLVARYGSDKFAVLLSPEAGSQKIAVRLRDVAERARAMVATKSFAGIRLSASIGAFAFAGDRLTAKQVVARADELLGSARRRGQGNVEVG